MTKLAFFTHNLGLGGAQRVIVNLTTELAERGRDVEIVLVEKRGELLADVHEDVPVIDLDTEPFIPAVLDLRRYLKRRRPDVLLSTVNTANLMAILAVKTTRTGTRHVVRMANTPSKKAQEYDGKWTDRLIPYLMKALYPLGNEFITISEGLADDLVSNYHVDRDDITVIYNPCVTDEMLEKGKEPIKCEWLFEPEIKVILGVGSLSQQKDFQTLIQAFTAVREQDDQYRLVIVGEGPQREELETLCDNLGVDDDVALPGEVTNPYPYFSNADLFVLSSRWEGFGIVTVEALAFGTPVVATDCPHGPREILENGKYGTLVPIRDLEALSKAIIEVDKSPISKSVLYERAREFHTSEISKEYERLLLDPNKAHH